MQTNNSSNQVPVPNAVPAAQVTMRTLDLADKSGKLKLFAGVGLAAVAIGGVFLFPLLHKGKAVGAPPQQAIKRPLGPVVTPGDQAKQAIASAGSNEVTTQDILNTRLPDASAAQGTGTQQTSAPHNQVHPTQVASAKPLNSIPPFSPPQYAQASAPQQQLQPSISPEAERAYQDQVSKPSLVFAAQESVPTNAGKTASAAEEPITNFGVLPGFHVVTHLESTVSTVGGTPAVAVVQYDYSRGGRVLIPAGSRFIGKIGAASSTGLVNIQFDQIYLPDGSRVPVKAIGLNNTLNLIKGKVSGKNTGKQFLLASLAGLGSSAALFAGNNTSSAISESDLMRQQAANNIGQAGDQVVQSLAVSSHIVVTVSAGTLVYATFVEPTKDVAASLK